VHHKVLGSFVAGCLLFLFYAVMPWLIVVFLPLALCKMLALQRLTVSLILLLFFLLMPFLFLPPLSLEVGSSTLQDTSHQSSAS